MKIHFLGTCAGTEPVPGRRHVSFVVEHGGKIYWFDAGEGCSYTAHLLGLDLLSVSAVFITHVHLDHVGGLENLLWNIRKINRKTPVISGKKIDVFIPNMRSWNGIMQVLNETEGGFDCDFDIVANSVNDGDIYNENGFKVYALHNNHLARQEGEDWQSFSYRIEAEGRSIVYSGDIKSMSDIDSLIGHCDLLLIETGHHKVEDICEFIKNNNKNVKRLGFIHNGRAIIANPFLELKKAREILGKNVFITEDKTSIEIK